jgi:hypothetical protein
MPSAIIIVMGSGAETAEDTALYLNQKGEKVGVVTVHLYRPFPSSTCWRPCLPPPARLPCWTAPRNRARTASRFTWM